MLSQKKSATFSLERDDETWILSGVLDAGADLKPILATPPPLKFDLRNLHGISSYGIRLWLDMLTAWGNRPVEIRGCTPPFVSALNVVPAAVGLDRANVLSVLVPYSCPVCNHYMETEMTVAEVVRDDGDIVLPDVGCEECGNEARVVAAIDDYFLFATWKPSI